MVSVYFYVPNLIGYGRILLLVACYFVWVDSPILFLSFYFISFALDAFDGMAARAFNQCSQFGAVLDMVTDRVGTALLVHSITLLYNNYWISSLGLFLNGLDLASHWVTMYSSLYGGSESHKEMAGGKNILLKMYYSKNDRKFMLACCLGAETFYIYAFFNYFYPEYYNLLAYFVLGFLWFMKQVVNVIQLGSSFDDIIELEKMKEKEKKEKENE